MIVEIGTSNSYSGNTCFEFSIFCVFVVKLNMGLWHIESALASHLLKIVKSKATFALLLFYSLWVQGSDTGDNKLTNQFSFVERATQTMNCALKVANIK